jgi:hypothetical protein
MERLPQAYTHVGFTLVSMNDWTSLERWQRITRQRHPDSYRLKEIDIIAKFMEGKPLDAAEMGRLLHQQHPKNSEVLAFYTDLATVAGFPEAEDLTRRSQGDSLDPAFSQWMLLSESARVRYAYFAARSGDRKRATGLLEEAHRVAEKHWNAGVDTPLLPVEFAAIHALRGDVNGGLEWMQRAYDRGWRFPASSKADPMLANLRTDARFGQLIARMEADLARMRQDNIEVRQLFSKTVPFLPPTANQP